MPIDHIWHEKDFFARSYFIATIEIPQQRTLVNCNTAHEMWLRISAQHLKNTADNQHALEQRFYEYRFQPDHDMSCPISPKLKPSLTSFEILTHLSP